jgi:hypothetical protein
LRNRRVTTWLVLIVSTVAAIAFFAESSLFKAARTLAPALLPKVLVQELISKNPTWDYKKLRLEVGEMFPPDLNKERFIAIVQSAGFNCSLDANSPRKICEYWVDTVPESKQDGVLYRALVLEPRFGADNKLESVKVLYSGLIQR